MAEASVMERGRVGRNDPCPCGSGKKYKRCHLEADEKTGREALVADDAIHAHTDHALCRHYRPVSTGLPAHMRPDFRHLLTQMRAEGYTLMHIGDPRSVGKDERDFKRAVSLAAEYGVDVHCAHDPYPEDLQLAQGFADRLFGAGAYIVRPASENFRRYPHPSEILGDDGSLIGVNAAYWSTVPSFLVRMRLDEWARSGGPSRPALLVRTAMAADVLRDLLQSCRDLMSGADADPAHGWARAHQLFVDLDAISRKGEEVVDEDDEAPGLVFAAAVGLAVHGGLTSAVEAEIAALALPGDAEEWLLTGARALQTNHLAEDLARAVADGALMEGEEVWRPRLTPRLAELLGDEPAPSEAAAAPAQTPKPVAEVAAAAQPDSAGTPSGAPVSDLFADVDIAGTGYRSVAERFQDQMESLFSVIDRCNETAQDLERQAEENGRLQASTLDRLEAIQSEMAAEIEADRQDSGRRLVEVLKRGAAELAQASDDWAARHDDDVEAEATSGEETGLRQIIESYEASKGALAQLDESLRAILEARVAEARAALGEEEGGTDARPTRVVPVAISVDLSDGLVRVGAGLPLDGLSPDALVGGSLEAILASVVTKQLADAVRDHGSLDQHRGLTTHLGHGVTWIWMEAQLNSEASADPGFVEDYLEFVCAEAANRDPVLRRAGVAVEVKAVPVDLLGAVSGLEEAIG